MLVVISPAKRLDWSPTEVEPTMPEFQHEASILASHARALTLGKLKGLMDLSDDLARLNRDRFRAFEDQSTEQNAKAAMFAFAGDTYMGLEAKTLNPDALNYARDHLRILSGLYGVLRPMDAIQPYRLEMGSRLKTRRGKNLYDFWRDGPAKALNKAGEQAGTEFLVNCASQEYFGAVDRKKLKLRVIEPVFMEVKSGVPKIVSFFAKKARGSMARFIVENRVTSLTGLQDFDLGGYQFSPDSSESDRLVFLRDEAVAHSFKEAS